VKSEQQRAYAREYYKKNRETILTRAVNWASANPEKLRATIRRRTYGTDGADLLAKQNGCCAICAVDLSTLSTRNRHIDHCHKTGAVRAWLCGNCNRGIAAFSDDAEKVAAAAHYLKGSICA
jgi:hypothetical protein